MRLDKYNNDEFDRGRAKWVELLWIVISGLSFSTWLPGSGWRCALLRAFGANIAAGVVIKPRVRVKFPWKLTVGQHSWIGESVWIDSLDQVVIGEQCCVSQGVFFCTGNHRWDSETFDLVTRPIIVEDRCWLAAKVLVAPGTVIRQGAVLSMGLTAQGEVSAMTIHTGSGFDSESDKVIARQIEPSR